MVELGHIIKRLSYYTWLVIFLVATQAQVMAAAIGDLNLMYPEDNSYASPVCHHTASDTDSATHPKQSQCQCCEKSQACAGQQCHDCAPSFPLFALLTLDNINPAPEHERFFPEVSSGRPGAEIAPPHPPPLYFS